MIRVADKNVSIFIYFQVFLCVAITKYGIRKTHDLIFRTDWSQMITRTLNSSVRWSPSYAAFLKDIRRQAILDKSHRTERSIY